MPTIQFTEDTPRMCSRCDRTYTPSVDGGGFETIELDDPMPSVTAVLEEIGLPVMKSIRVSVCSECLMRHTKGRVY